VKWHVTAQISYTSCANKYHNYLQFAYDMVKYPL